MTSFTLRHRVRVTRNYRDLDEQVRALRHYFWILMNTAQDFPEDETCVKIGRLRDELDVRPAPAEDGWTAMVFLRGTRKATPFDPSVLMLAPDPIVPAALFLTRLARAWID